jgi:hypothetical protein
LQSSFTTNTITHTLTHDTPFMQRGSQRDNRREQLPPRKVYQQTFLNQSHRHTLPQCTVSIYVAIPYHQLLLGHATSLKVEPA